MNRELINMYSLHIEKQASNQEFDWTAFQDHTGKLTNKLLDVMEKNKGEYSAEEYSLRDQLNSRTPSDYGFDGDYERVADIPYEFKHKAITDFMEGRPNTKFSKFRRTDNGFVSGRDSAEYLLGQYDNLLKKMPSAKKEQSMRVKAANKADKVLAKSEKKYNKLNSMKPSMFHPFLESRKLSASKKLESAKDNRFEANYKLNNLYLDREEIEGYKNSINESLKNNNHSYQWGMY